MKASLDCLFCMVKKNDEIYSQYEKDEDKRIAFLKTAMSIISKANPSDSAPLTSTKIIRALSKITDTDDHYIEEKKSSNEFVMKMEDKIIENIEDSENKLVSAIQYALAGNYIDFGAMSDVNDETLQEIVDKSHEFVIDEKVLASFESDLQNAKSLVYLTDNAGEIVFDKILIQALKDIYPNVKINAIVRGYPIYNDATMQDAVSIGLDKVVDVYDNGFDAPGTVLSHINKKSQQLIDDADLIISKGMGNFETLYGCGKNIYYAFLCKCVYFTKRFGMKQFEGIFKNESDIEL